MENKHIPKLGTLCFIVENDQILLGQKKYGEMSSKLVFPGGKIEYSDKSIYESITREVKEETGLDIEKPILISRIDFGYSHLSDVHSVYVFKSDKHNGLLVETEELLNNWYPIKQIPFEKMWDSDKLWFFSAFDNRQNIIKIKKNISQEVEDISIKYQKISIPNLKNQKS